jgi:CheY-like chemotaxis protein
MKPKLLLADDSRGDGILIHLAFADARLEIEIIQAWDGGQAFELIQAARACQPFPYQLIVIDLNLPKINGLELLDRLQGLPELVGVPTMILTSSTNPSDRLRGLRRNPTAFLTKPDDYRGLSGVVAAMAPHLFPASPASAR